MFCYLPTDLQFTATRYRTVARAAHCALRRVLFLPDRLPFATLDDVACGRGLPTTPTATSLRYYTTHTYCYTRYHTTRYTTHYRTFARLPAHAHHGHHLLPAALYRTFDTAVCSNSTTFARLVGSATAPPVTTSARDVGSPFYCTHHPRGYHVGLPLPRLIPLVGRYTLHPRPVYHATLQFRDPPRHTCHTTAFGWFTAGLDNPSLITP